MRRGDEMKGDEMNEGRGEGRRREERSILSKDVTGECDVTPFPIYAPSLTIFLFL